MESNQTTLSDYENGDNKENSTDVEYADNNNANTMIQLASILIITFFNAFVN